MKVFRTFAALSLCLSAAAGAQEPQQPVRVRGTIAVLDGAQLSIETPTDGVVGLTLTDATGINGLEARTVADIGESTFIGATAIKDAAGRWRATEIHIFPESMRGAGEGHYAWDLPESTMTNGAVTGNAAIADGRALRVTYADGETEIEISPRTVIVGLTAGDRSLLVPGATVFALAVPAQDGRANAIAIIAETGGVKPPM